MWVICFRFDVVEGRTQIEGRNNNFNRQPVNLIPIAFIVYVCHYFGHFVPTRASAALCLVPDLCHIRFLLKRLSSVQSNYRANSPLNSAAVESADMWAHIPAWMLCINHLATQEFVVKPNVHLHLIMHAIMVSCTLTMRHDNFLESSFIDFEQQEARKRQMKSQPLISNETRFTPSLTASPWDTNKDWKNENKKVA